LNAIEIAQLAAKSGAEVLLRYWMNLGKEDAALKARNDWVSQADRESEQTIIDIIQQHAPADTILGEESGNVPSKKGSSERSWVIDPLDGTSNYLQHFPFWCISIGIRDGGETTGAVIYEPLREQMFVAEKGSGAFLNGERIHVSGHEELEGAFLATGFPFRAQKHVSVYTQIFGDVISVVKGVRRAGSAALDLAYTAQGVFDGFFELHLAPWDVAAGALLVREAGGAVSDFSGGDLFWERGNIVGAAPGVHEKLLRLIARHAREAQLER
jgi:myo-inositol-1(or 4)-monophosphatase